MKIIGDHTIEFRTVDPWYSREKGGEKKNTVRKISDPGRLELVNVLFHLSSIRITNAETGDTFERTLTDVSYFDGVFIFSWG